MIYMFHLLTRIKDYIYRKQVSRNSEFEIKYVGSHNTAHIYATLFSVLRSIWSLIRCIAYVFFYDDVYPIGAKLIAVFRSRPGNLSYELDQNTGEYCNKKPHY